MGLNFHLGSQPHNRHRRPILVGNSRLPQRRNLPNPEERDLVRRRLEADGQHGACDEKWSWKPFFDTLEDWKTWTGAVMYMGVDGALYAFSLFLQSVIFAMGYTALNAQFMSVAPYAVACIVY